MDDAKIIDLFWDREEDAIQETDKAYGRKLYVLANKILNNREDAQACESDTYMKTWKSFLPSGRKYDSNMTVFVRYCEKIFKRALDK